MGKRDVSIDDTTIKLAIAGKHSAYHTIYRKTYGRLYFICYRYAKDADEASDWCQDAYLKLFDSLHKFNDNSAAFITWAHTLFRNFCIDRYRRKNIKKMVPIDYYDSCPLGINDTSLKDFTETEAEELIKMKAETMLDLIRTKLSDVERTVFNMYVIDGIMLKDVAIELEIKPSTIRGVYLRARTKLKEEFNNLSSQKRNVVNNLVN